MFSYRIAQLYYNGHLQSYDSRSQISLLAATLADICRGERYRFEPTGERGIINEDHDSSLG